LERRYPTQADRAELANLYHLARTALSGTQRGDSRHARMIWAAAQFTKGHPEWTHASAYKAVEEAIERTD